MKRDEAFELAIQWRENPVLLVGDLRATLDWLWQNSEEAPDAVARATGARVMVTSLIPESLERLIPLHKALTKYAILLKASKLTPELLDPVIQSLAPPDSAPASVVSATPVESFVTLASLSPVMEAIEVTQRWVDKQERLRNGEGNRSEILKTSIEVADDELLVKTDQDGSLKLRGTSNIPMFLAFFRTSKHHLTIDQFLDIDRTVKPTNLDRHRVRLSSKLHDVMIEIVSEKDGYRMQKFRQH